MKHSKRELLEHEGEEILAQLDGITSRNSVWEKSASNADSYCLQRIKDEESEENIRFSRMEFAAWQEIHELARRLKDNEVALSASKDTFPDRASDAGYTNPRPDPFPTEREFEEDLYPTIQDGASSVGFNESPVMEDHLRWMTPLLSVASATTACISAWSFAEAVEFRFGRFHVTSIPLAMLGIVLGVVVGLGFSSWVFAAWQKLGGESARKEYVPLTDEEDEGGSAKPHRQPASPKMGGPK